MLKAHAATELHDMRSAVPKPFLSHNFEILLGFRIPLRSVVDIGLVRSIVQCKNKEFPLMTMTSFMVTCNISCS